MLVIKWKYNFINILVMWGSSCLKHLGVVNILVLYESLILLEAYEISGYDSLILKFSLFVRELHTVWSSSVLVVWVYYM